MGLFRKKIHLDGRETCKVAVDALTKIVKICNTAGMKALLPNSQSKDVIHALGNIEGVIDEFKAKITGEK